MQYPRPAGRISITVADNRALLGEAAALAVATTIRRLHERQSGVNIVFAAAPSQDEFLAALAQQSLDWRRIHAFHMDEYLGLGAEAPQSFGYYLRTHLFDAVSPATVSLLDGLATDTRAECRRYSGLLDNSPVDIVCMGIGENNHLAFNDPPVADFHDAEKVKPVTLDADCRQQQVNDGCFPSLEAVPRQALTLTIPALMAGRYCFVIVPGERKARAVYNTLHQPVSERYPSTILRRHPAVELFLDSDSSKLI